MTFYEDWKERYLNKTCTLEHLQRLQKIGKLTDQEVKQILIEKRKRDKGMI